MLAKTTKSSAPSSPGRAMPAGGPRPSPAAVSEGPDAGGMERMFQGVPDRDFTVPYACMTLPFREGVAFTADYELWTFLFVNGCPVHWSNA